MNETNVPEKKNEYAEGIISFTTAAIDEVNRLIGQQEDNDGLMLRVGVQGGGCSGLSYKMEFAKAVDEFDRTFDFDTLTVIVDAKSLVYLNGTTIDFSSEILSGGFKFNNPMSSRDCSCGSSFSV
jgi:iron-sulfur cluster assembly protein